MGTIFRFSSLLLCLVLISCTLSTPTLTQVIIPTSTTLSPTQTNTPTYTALPPTQTIVPTGTPIPTAKPKPTHTARPTLSPNAITFENATMLMQVGTFKTEGDYVSDIAFSPDSKLLATGDARMDLTQPIDIVLWNLETKTEFKRLSGHLGIVNAIAFNPNGRQLASGGVDGTVRLWDTATGESTIILEGYPMIDGTLIMYGTTLKNFPVTSLAYNQTGTLLAVGGGGFWNPGWLELYDPIAETHLTMLSPTECTYPCDGVSHVEDQYPDIADIAFSPDGMLLASGDVYGGIKIWDIASEQILHTLTKIHRPTCLAFSPNGKILAVGEYWGHCSENSCSVEEIDYYLGDVRFWDVETGQELDLFDVVGESVNSIAFSPDGNLLTVGRGAGSVELWDMITGLRLSQIDNVTWPVIITFSPDGSLLAIGDSSGVIRLWGIPGD